MKVDFDTTITDINGNVCIVEMPDGEKKPIKLGFVCVEALLSDHPDDKGMPGADRLARLRLAQLANKHDEQDIPADDVVLIRTLVARHWNTLIVGRVWEIMN